MCRLHISSCNVTSEYKVHSRGCTCACQLHASAAELDDRRAVRMLLIASMQPGRHYLAIDSCIFESGCLNLPFVLIHRIGCATQPRQRRADLCLHSAECCSNPKTSLCSDRHEVKPACQDIFDLIFPVFSAIRMTICQSHVQFISYHATSWGQALH